MAFVKLSVKLVYLGIGVINCYYELRSSLGLKSQTKALRRAGISAESSG